MKSMKVGIAVIIASVSLNAFAAKPGKPKYALCPDNKQAYKYSSIEIHKFSSSIKFKPKCVWVRKQAESIEVSLFDGLSRLDLRWRPQVPNIVPDPQRKYVTSVGAPVDTNISYALRRSVGSPIMVSHSKDSWIRIRELPANEGDNVHFEFD